ncbi:hypothetical protein F-E9_513 [Faustovirus]|nr:hypothetical protein F-E9_513 [Faustovirus]
MYKRTPVIMSIVIHDDILKHVIMPYRPWMFTRVSKRWRRLAAIEMYNRINVWHHDRFVAALMALNGPATRHLIASFTRRAYTYEIPKCYDWNGLQQYIYVRILYSTQQLPDALYRVRDHLDVDVRGAFDLYVRNFNIKFES